ncbi:glycosyltransferase family 4 protein [Bacillus sp. V2I10]|uniref:glycosyltransferase family 4 protein n=1 Tax=Bacillus sp. V2I10 TaxID=3042276 RepID=UPI00277E7A7B|nr:glycosyltransferase family 4 protein [Bacillus sp. V2I10]MDQ0857147.1 glycosyltransferase involved in cell wall biosynthesis [Bacillus sp. V2I10]
MLEKKTVLIFTPYYIPGFKGGGPIRSISNLVDALGNDFNFKIVTYDRDFGDQNSYKGIKQNAWNTIGQAEVFYVNHNWISFNNLKNFLNTIKYDLIYLNSFFSFKFSIMQMLLRKLNLIPQKPIVLAPRGEFSPGALKIKEKKKTLFIYLTKLIKLHSNVQWHGTSLEEKEHIIQNFGDDLDIHVASNLPSSINHNLKSRKKVKGSLKLVFLSRISPKKNLDGALKSLKQVSIPMVFNIYGPIEDSSYWDECKKIIETLPSNILVKYEGEIDNNKVSTIFLNHDALFFPTHGENYGHVIVESLLSGCPVILSDQTPWRELDKHGIGWDIPLKESNRFAAIFQELYDMDENDFGKISNNIRLYIDNNISNSDAIEDSIGLFS